MIKRLTMKDSDQIRPETEPISINLLGANAVSAWTAGYWLVYRGGLDRLHGRS